MKNHQKKAKKLLTAFGAFSLIVANNSSELKARYSPNNTNNLKKEFFTGYKVENFKNTNTYQYNFLTPEFNNEATLIANAEEIKKTSVLISEIVIEGWEDHPEGRKLELAAYDAMSIKPGSVVDNNILKKDLDSIYATGWFSGVKIKAEDGPLGVKLIVQIIPNPILNEVVISPANKMVPKDLVYKTFNKYYGTTLNLNELQQRIKIIKKWYEEKGYSLARISGPERIADDGIVQLKIDEGIVSEIKIRFIGTDEEVRKGKTKEWVIRRELKTNSGVIFNRRILERDIKRLYSTSLFNDVKVSLSPDDESPEKVIITLDISEQRTGSLTGGIGYSNAAGIFAQMGLQETNAFGRAWSTSLNLNFGEYSTTYNFTLFDPWIKGDKHKTAFKTNVFLSRDYPQEFRSENNGRFYGVDAFHKAAGTSTATEISKNDPVYTSVAAAKIADSSKSWFDYEGNSVVLENIGGGFAFIRPLNGGDPFRESAWRISAGMNFKKVRVIDGNGNDRPYAITNSSLPTTKNVNEIICLGYSPKDGSCPAENTLTSVILSSSRNKLNNNANPTSGNIFRIGSEQFIPIGENSPTFNRMRASYAWFIPTKLINLTKDCRSENSDSSNCPQTIGFQFKVGTIVGDLPPYESFCMGGASSVRGWGSCDLAVSKSFAEASAEYRFPIWRMISGSFFADAGTDLSTQDEVPGKPGKLLRKSGSGYSLGGGLGVKTPVGPIRLDAASQDLSGNMRYTLGVGWKF